jgi:putative endonuclease
MGYWVYIVKCSDGTFYTGYTNDLAKRLKVHNGEADNESGNKAGAKYTRSRRPVILYYSEELDNKSSAMKREYQIKQLSRKQKEDLINFNPINMAKGQDRKKEKKKPKQDKTNKK